MYKLCFYVPTENADAVKTAIFATGAGKIGEYEQCAWQCEGIGQFLPSHNANPTIGENGTLTVLSEVKIELVCDDKFIRSAIIALLAAHPYEEPAYQIWQVMTLQDLP